MGLPPPSKLAALWERKLRRFPELLDPDELERGLGYRHVFDGDAEVASFYQAAETLLPTFARQERLSRKDRKVLALYVAGESIRGATLTVSRGRRSVRLLVRRFEAFCRSKGLTPRVRYASRKVTCRSRSK